MSEPKRFISKADGAFNDIGGVIERYDQYGRPFHVIAQNEDFKRHVAPHIRKEIRKFKKTRTYRKGTRLVKRGYKGSKVALRAAIKAGAMAERAKLTLDKLGIDPVGSRGTLDMIERIGQTGMALSPFLV